MIEFKLVSANGLSLGGLLVSSINGMRVIGSFLPDRDFDLYGKLFKEHERAVNEQLFIEEERLMKEIDSLGLYVVGPSPGTDSHSIENLQIMEGGASFRLMIDLGAIESVMLGEGKL
ncbi:hypothetical protein [Pseudomonas entomophila]|uniref:Uncharacterized protein n=1 Tax=Pseudomonas entomophila TaxID=312306 RepID=A0ABY9QNN4_9PSED|nr:hypothetical protein [Pseudomonas entomophila]WMW05389.1 hypothetical protein RAH46_24185 [Pseudomonas entomophila]